MFLLYFRYVYVIALVIAEILMLIKRDSKKIKTGGLILMVGFMPLFRIFNRIDRIKEVAILIEQYPMLDIVYIVLSALAVLLAITLAARLKKERNEVSS